MTISDFISRCDRYCADAGVSRTWLSKRLFADTFRIQSLADGKSDVGVNRLARAMSDLEALEAIPTPTPANDPDVEARGEAA